MRRPDADLNHFESALDVPFGVGDGLAVLAREYLCEFVIVALRQFEEFHQHAHASLRIGRRPGRLRRLGVLDSCTQFGGRGERDRTAHRAVHRLHHVLLASAGAGDALAADEMAIFDHVSLPGVCLVPLLSRLTPALATRAGTQPLCEN
jgi:hypothetical protein